ncbi:MAG: TonB-dependent receptor [Saprospiraceae bacterium]
MKTLIKFIILFIFSINVLSAQNTNSSKSPSLLYGNVFNQDGENLIGATIVWDGTTIATVTDLNGDFWLPKMDTTAFLEISYVGYDAVYIEMFPHEDTAFIKIEGVTELQTIEVAGQRSDVFTSTLDPINMENISACELKKAACCNLAESFETSGSVDVMKADAVTSTTEILMLGLRGIYSQLLIEKRPAYTGLGYPFALENIPGTWVSGIQVSKGASTVQNGPQSITGQINIELVKPWQDKPLFVNLFGSTTERGEANLHWNKNWTEKMSTGVILHGSTTRGEFDKNGDTFLDQQTKQSLNGLFRSFYRTDNFSTQLNLQVINDEREGGQIMPQNQPDPATYYRSKLQNKRVDLFGKFGYFGFDRPATSIGFIYNASWQDMDNVFGQNIHTGDQKRLYANLLFSTCLATTTHTLNLGTSIEYDDYDEFLNMADFSRKEVMPGAYAEYVYNSPGSGFGVIAGVRADHHNNFGTFATPRVNVKYNFTENSIVRLSAGRGVRSAQVLAENLPILATNTEVEVLEKLKMEDAWNLGLNFTQSFNLFGRSASFVADLYRTDFNNQIIVDMESQLTPNADLQPRREELCKQHVVAR